MTLLFLSDNVRRCWNAMRRATWRRVSHHSYQVLEGVGSGWVVTLCALPDGSAPTCTASFPRNKLLYGMPDTFAKELMKEALKHVPVEWVPSSEAHSTTPNPQGDTHET